MINTCEICGDDYNVFKHKINGMLLCSKHRHQINRYNMITDKHPSHRRNKDLTKCEVCGSETHIEYNKIAGKILCGKHSAQVRRNGKILERTIYDDNEIIVYETYAEIVLYDTEGKETKRAIIDIDDVEKVENHKWYYLHNCDFGKGYTSTKIDGKNLLLHKLITNTDDSIVIDHINCNKLDCRKDNLRYADKIKNSQNRKPPKNNSSGFTGVSWNINRNRWYAKIVVDEKPINIGSSKDKKEAVLMRLKAEIIHFKEFRNSHNEEEYIRQYGELPDDIKLLINKYN